MPDGAGRLRPLAARQQRLQARFVTDQQETRAGMPLGGDAQTFHDDVGCAVTAHGVDREGERLGPRLDKAGLAKAGLSGAHGPAGLVQTRICVRRGQCPSGRGQR